jgi:hypothetical protein
MQNNAQVKAFKARGEYRNLLDDWKDAGPDITELVDAKKNIASAR